MENSVFIVAGESGLYVISVWHPTMRGCQLPAYHGSIEYAEISIVLTIARTISYRHLSIAISSL